MTRRIASCLILAVAGPAIAEPVLPEFAPELFGGEVLENRWFPLTGGDVVILEASGIDDEGEVYVERTELSIAGLGRVILGVPTVAQLDKTFEDGLLVEETLDYFATDHDGNVWYFGEDVTNYVYDEDDNLIETNDDSAWLAGVDDASPGWIMPAEPKVGMSYYQEAAKAVGALDWAEIYALNQTVEIPGVGTFNDVVVVYEIDPLETDSREFKYYAPGIGLIQIEEDLSEDLTDPELVFRLR